MKIQSLTSVDAEAYNAFLLRGLTAHPQAFRISPEDVQINPFPIPGPDESDVTLAAVDSAGTLLGVVTLARDRLRKMRHKAWLVRMYVALEAARQGVGRALLREAIAYAGKMVGVEQINLTVIADNEYARRLYLSEGFLPFAHEVGSLKDGGTYRDEEQMALRLIPLPPF